MHARRPHGTARVARPGAGWAGALLLAGLLALPPALAAAIDAPEQAGAAASAPLEIDPALAAWLARRDAVRFAPEADYGPFVYAEPDGSVAGLSIDVLRLVQRHTGLRVVTLAPQPLHHNLQAARARQVDLLSSLRPTAERAEYLDFSLPYISVPAVVVMRMRPDGQARAGDEDLLARLAGRPVAVGRGYAVEAYVRQQYPRVDWQPVADDVQALRGVLTGRYDAAVADSASAAFAVQHHALRGLEVVSRVGFEYALSFAVRKDWPELRAVIDTGIRAIGAAERRALLERWAPALRHAEEPPRARAASVLAVALLALAAAVAAWGTWKQRRRAALPGG